MTQAHLSPDQNKLLEQLPDPVLVWEWEGTISLWNSEAERLYGFSAAEARGSVSHTLLQTSCKNENFIQDLEQAGSWQGELEHTTKEGRRLIIESRMVLIREPAGAYVIESNRDITSRKKTETSQQESEAWLRTVTDSARIGMVIVDEQHRYRYANRAYAEILRLPYHDLVGRRVSEVLAPAYDSQIRPRLERAFQGERVAYELTLNTHGETHCYSVTYEPSTDHMGQSVIVVLLEITEKKAFENALRVSEERLRSLIEGVADYAIVMLGPTGEILTWSKEAERLNGYSAAELIGKNYSLLFSPEDITLGVPQEALERAAAAGKIELEGWRLRKDGSRFWVNGTLSALHDSNGKVWGFAKISRDLTERRRNDKLLRSVLDHTLDGIISIDEQGTISVFNHASEMIFGHTAEEVVGHNVMMLMPEPYHTAHDGYIHNYLQTGHAKVIGVGREVRGLCKDGSTFPMSLAVTEFQFDQHRHFVGIVRDLSKTKLLEEQLRQSQKLEAVGQLAGGVAHDFNNLLTIISGNSELLAMSFAPESEDKALLDDILHAGERASALTRQLLAFSRQQVLEPKILDLNDIVSDTEKMLRRLLGEDIVLTTVLRPSPHRVKVDPGQLVQVIMNLAINARDAMPQGGRLTIETNEIELSETYAQLHAEISPGRFIMLALSDTGEGMTPEIRSRIFEPFFTTKGAGKGTGLGLAVVHGIVKQSGGSIEVYTEPDLGTTVKVYLPIVQQSTTKSPNTDLANAPQGTETILLVEDDESVRELAVRGLQRFSYRVLKARNGQEALRIIESRPGTIDLLVTDVVMPEMSGRALAEILQAKHPKLKILFVSGYTDDAVVRHGVLQAQVAFLQKPFTPASLARKVREVLDQPSSKAS